VIDRSKLGSLRKHQRDALAIVDRIVSGDLALAICKVMVASVTPGGGKTLMASLFAHVLLAAGVVDFVVIVVPRTTLRGQMARGFTDEARGLRRHIAIEANGKVDSAHKDLFGACGYVSTYQAVAEHPKKHLRRFKGKRVLLILDEPHHLADEEGVGWKSAIDPLVEAATCVLLMSGTLRRHDGRRIPYVTYDDNAQAVVDIRYDYGDALRERAVLDTRFLRLDARVTYERRGKLHERDLSSTGSEDQERDALKTVLTDDGYRNEVCLQALKEWQDYRTDVYHRAQAIVVAHTQSAARDLASLIRSKTDLPVALAISDEQGAHKAVRAFQRGEAQILVTVGMAYEGLDVPAATHLICLTNVRSEPWLEQCFARVTRHNTACPLPWEQQIAHVYVPDDPAMRSFIDRMLTAKVESYDLTGDEQGEAAKRKPPVRASTFCAIEAMRTVERTSAPGLNLDAQDDQLVQAAYRRWPGFKLMPLTQVVDIVRKLPTGMLDGEVAR